MKKNLVYLLCVIALLTSCSSAYRTAQTPDDVYYSPSQRTYSDDRYESYTSSSDDDYLRMKVRNHYRWGYIDDYDYWYDSRYYYSNYYNPWSVGFSLGFGYNPYYSYNQYWYNPWRSWHSPYYTVVYYKNPRVYYKPGNNYTLAAYNNRNYNNYNMPLQNGNRNRNLYNNSNSNANRFRNNNFNTNQNNNSKPTRMFNNSNSNPGGGSRPGGGSSGGGGGHTRPPRG